MLWLKWHGSLVINKILSYFQGIFFKVLKAFHCKLICIFSTRLLSTVDSHYLQVQYLQICLCSKIYLWPQNQYLQCFRGHLQKYTQCWKFLLIRHAVLSECQSRQDSPFMFQLSYSKQVSFSRSIQCPIFHVFVLFGVLFCCLKWTHM